MNQDVSVFDLGNADTTPDAAASRSVETSIGNQRPAAGPAVKPIPQTPAPTRIKPIPHLAGLRRWPGVTRSLSLLIPGAGQLVRGETAFGLFLFTASLFLWSFAWSILETLDRLAGTLALFGLSVLVAFWTLCGVYILAASLHLAGALSSIDSAAVEDEVVYHPLVTGTASALIPGWGQLLNGDRIRAGLFLACVWIAGGLWIALSPAATELLSAYLPAVSAWEQAARRPGPLWIGRFTFPAVVWALAVYDAAASSIYWRR